MSALPQLAFSGLDFFSKKRSTLGDVYRLQLGPMSIVMLNQPRHVDHIMRTNARNYVKQGPLWESLRGLVGNGLSTAEGERWRRKRRLIQPRFQRSELPLLADSMRSAIDESFERWQFSKHSEVELDLAREFSRATMAVVCRAMFGSAMPAEQSDRVSAEMERILDHVMLGVMTFALPKWIPVPGRRRFRKAVKRIDDVVLRMVDRRDGDVGQQFGSLIASLATDSNDPMSDPELRDEAVTLFLTGHETTAQMLSWAVHELLVQPELMLRVRHEVDEVLGSRAPTWDDLGRLSLCRRLLLESLRQYAPVYWLSRTAVEADEIDGHAIPAGQVVMVLSHVLHHHPDHWESPLRFDPDRFLPEACAKRDRLAFVPFGAGQRQCIGEEFALMEGQLVLARLLQRYELYPIAHRRARPRMSTTLRPRGGVWARLQHRSTGG